MRNGKVVLAEVIGIALVAVVGLVALRGCTLVRVGGGSMSPSLETGDVVIVQHGVPASVGDIVLFRLDGDNERTLHRVSDVTGGGLVTRGDANPVADRRCVPRPSVIGRVRWVIPFGVLRERLRGRSCDTVPSQSQSARL